MFNVGGGEVLVILVLALVVLGPDKLPEAARSIGKHIGDFRRISNGFRSEISNAMDLSSFTGPSDAPAPSPVAPQRVAQEPVAPTPSPAPNEVVEQPAVQPVRAAAAEPAPATTAAAAPTMPVRSSVPAATPHQDLELVPSAPVWADGPVDSFV